MYGGEFPSRPLLPAPGPSYQPPVPSYQPPAPSYHEPAKGMPYNFAYGVKDDYTGTDFAQEENSDGNTVQGSYSVQLPDGRKQTVQYTADHYNGYQAQVGYYGEAQYPSDYGTPVTYRPAGYGHQQPSYPPPPVYQPEPTYL
ncbi:cuticle protein 7-like [Scylla paramamosain]|uniref:cuticle protein 7-like n=1 Tax=Scylla paramamosain TaxID=85552 RepID=UPI003083751B